MRFCAAFARLPLRRTPCRCAATKRRVRQTLDWQPFFDVAERESTYEARLAGYAKLARTHFEKDRFEEFCATTLKDLPAVAWEFFGTQEARDAMRAKVAAIYPPHEIEQFTELFWQRVQKWRATEGRV